jgi:hypothetical protein
VGGGTAGQGGAAGSAAGAGAAQGGAGGTPGTVDEVGETRGYEAGVTGGAALALLENDAQAQAVCKKAGELTTQAEIDRWTAGACALEGVSQQEQGNGSCASFQAACVQAAGTASKCTKAQFSDCVVTADAYVACVKAMADAAVAAYSGFTCSTPTSQFKKPATPDACKDVAPRCPNLGAN